MQYYEAVNALGALPHVRPKLGTETTAVMLSALDAEPTVPCVQVAGSNGKGSTARMLASMLRQADLQVGLYTSPDLGDLRERIRVDGRKVPRSAVTEFVERLSGHLDALRADDDEPTYFEVLTALALWYFDRRSVDVAVLEVGIGGRYDATSVVDPVASAVTSVSLEHTDLLGDTVAEIARDKGTVAPADRPLVTATEGVARETLETVADLVTVGGPDADVTVAEGGMASLTETTVTIEAEEFAVEARSPLLGAHQARNAGIAAVLARQVADADTGAIARGLRSAHWPGRFEIMEREPLVVLDGAHNPGAVETMATLLARYDYDDLHVVLGAMAGKDHESMADSLPAATTLFACRPDTERAADPGTLAEVFGHRADTVETVASVPEAVERALAGADPDDCVLVMGSLYTVGEARDRWTRTAIEKRTDTVAAAESALETANVPAPSVAATGERAVSRTVKTSLRARQVDRLRALATDAGVTCAVSGVSAAHQRRDVVLTGPLPAWRGLLDALADGDHGFVRLAEQFRGALGWTDGPASLASDRTAVMGILNVTPDSFHDGGEYDTVDAAVARAREMVAQGADIVDVGGESTRPGADPVPVEAELDRVVPVVERVADLAVDVSVDTRKSAVARAALEAGADIVNDVSGFEDPALPAVAAEFDAPVVVMHSLSVPVDPTREGVYDDVVEDVIEELAERVLVAERAGLDREQVIVDPGVGFGKDAARSFELVDRIGEFAALGCPVLVGHSHKSLFEAVGCGPDERLPPTLAVTAMAADRGVDVVRVHDVAENAAAIRAAAATGGRGDGER